MTDARFDPFLPTLQEYRRRRTRRHTDDKVLTAWNSLMIAALCRLYRCSRDPRYLDAAKRAQGFLRTACASGYALCKHSGRQTGGARFSDDYASYIFALLSLYEPHWNAPFFAGRYSSSGKLSLSITIRTMEAFISAAQRTKRCFFTRKSAMTGRSPVETPS